MSSPETDSQRFAAVTEPGGACSQLRVKLVVEALYKLLTESGSRAAQSRGKNRRGRYRLYMPGRESRAVGRYALGAHLRSLFAREHPTLQLTGNAASPSRWASLADYTVAAGYQSPDDSPAANWVLDNLEPHPVPGSYLLRREVLDGFLKRFPGPERRRGAELFAALKAVEMFFPSPTGRAMADPAVKLNGQKVRVFFGLRLRPKIETQPYLFDISAFLKPKPTKPNV